MRNKKNCSYVMRVHEICDYTVKALPHDELVIKAKSFLKSRGLKKIAVTEENAPRVIGSVNREKIIELPSTQSNTVLLKDLAEELSLTAMLHEEVKYIIKKMLEKEEDCIPVVENDERHYAGILTLENILDALTKLGSENLNKPVDEVMNKNPQYARPNETICSAWKKMKSKKQTGLIVISEEKKIAGVITHHDLLASKVTWLSLALRDESGVHALYVADIMNKHVHKIKRNVTVLEASKQLLKYKIARLPVVDENDNFIGVIDRWILVKLLADTL